MRDRARRDAALHGRIPQPRAVQMQRQLAPVGQRTDRLDVTLRQHLAADRVLERDQPRLREVRVVGLDRGFDRGHRNRPVRRVVERLRLDAPEHGAAARLVAVRVRLLADDDLVAASAMRHHADQVRLRARRHVERRLETQQRGDLVLQRVDVGVVAEDVVADVRGRHRRAHRGRRPRHGIAAEIHRHRGLLVRFSLRP